MLQQEFHESDDGFHAHQDLLQNPLLSSSVASPELGSNSLNNDLPGPPLTSISEGCYVPPTGYTSYLPSPPRPLLPPLSHYSMAGCTHSQFAGYGPIPPPFGGHYSFPTASPLRGGGYSVLPLPPLHQFSRDHTRKRGRDEDVVDDELTHLNIAAKTAGAAPPGIPTPPESSDGSDTGSPVPLHMPEFPTTFPPSPLPQDGVEVRLCDKSEQLWRMFYAVNTEMIVTKGGRCLFPVLIFTVNGLTRKKDYNIYVRAVSKDQKRYKYLNNKWAPVSDSDVMHDNSRMIAKHPNSPQSGAKWMMRDVDFKSVKITHYSKSKGGDIFLNTFHKYFFEVVIEENQSDSEPLVFPFHLTRFVAVTAYQSAKLTELKKEKNPFARGVRHHESETDIREAETFYAPDMPNYITPYPPSTCGDGLGLQYPPPGPVPYPTPWTHNTFDSMPHN